MAPPPSMGPYAPGPPGPGPPNGTFIIASGGAAGDLGIGGPQMGGGWRGPQMQQQQQQGVVGGLGDVNAGGGGDFGGYVRGGGGGNGMGGMNGGGGVGDGRGAGTQGGGPASGRKLGSNPDFVAVYTFLGGLFDPEVRGHREKLKRMSPIDRETALLLMRNLGANLMCQRMWEDQIQLIGAGCPTFVNASGFDQDAREGRLGAGERANGQGSAVVETGRDNSGGSGSDGRGGRGGDGETNGGDERRAAGASDRDASPPSDEPTRESDGGSGGGSGTRNSDEPTATDVDVAPGDIARVTEAGESPVEAGPRAGHQPEAGATDEPSDEKGSERTADAAAAADDATDHPARDDLPAPSETTAEGTAAKATGAGGGATAPESAVANEPNAGEAKVEAAEANPEAS